MKLNTAAYYITIAVTQAMMTLFNYNKTKLMKLLGLWHSFAINRMYFTTHKLKTLILLLL